MISQLDGWPACAPVNASPPALRPSTHDSGSGWLARPFPCDSFIHDSSPVSRRTVRPQRAEDLGVGVHVDITEAGNAPAKEHGTREIGPTRASLKSAPVDTIHQAKEALKV